MPTDWSRRTVLGSGFSGVALALAGCIGGSRPSSDATTTAEPTETTSPASTQTRTTAQTSTSSRIQTTVQTPATRALDGEPFTELRVEPTPADSPFRHDVEFLAQPTADHPARIRVSIRNASDAAQTIQTSNWELPFPNPLAEARPDTGLVVSQDGDPSRTDDCWRDHAKSYPMIDSRTLAAGETLTKQYAVTNWTKNEICWPSGEYAFSQGYAVNPETDDDGYEWGFTLVI